MFKSTMGAPLSPNECAKINAARLDLRAALEVILDRDTTEPRDLLKEVSDIIGACWTLRSAIEIGWHRANDRAFTPHAKPRSDIVGLGPKAVLSEFSIDDILEAIAAIKESRKC